MSIYLFVLPYRSCSDLLFGLLYLFLLSRSALPVHVNLPIRVTLSIQATLPFQAFYPLIWIALPILII